MRKTFIGYLLALIPLSSYSCLQAGIGDNVPEKEYQTICMENDSLRPIRKWTFNYDDKKFPCDHGAYDGTIKGFDTDDKGHFYILGGEPVRLACFIGEQLEWSRDLSLSMRHCQNALFKMVNDSIYFINEVKYIYSYNETESAYFKDEAKFISYKDEANSIYRIHKSGKGELERFPLHIDGEYLEGKLRDNGFYVVARPDNVPDSVSLDDRSHDMGYLFTYPNKLQNKVSGGNGIAKLRLDGIPVFIDLENNPPYTGFYGKTDNFLIYGSIDYDIGSIAIIDTIRRTITKHPISGLPRLDATTGWFPGGALCSDNTTVIVNKHLYAIGYDNIKMTYTIVEYDLRPVLHLAHATAQPSAFRTFLSGFKKCFQINLSSFGEKIISDSALIDGDMYARFLPPIQDDCLCEQYNVFWQKGSYMECGGFITVMLKRHCQDYKDENSQYFIENDVADYMLVTYSRDGEILDFKTVGHDGRAYFTRIPPKGQAPNFLVQQGSLDDCTSILRYQDLTYTVRTYEYNVSPDGKIKERTTGTAQKETIKNPENDRAPIRFEEFMSYFKKWEKPYVNDSLFIPSTPHTDLPFPECFSLIPDTLDCGCWPRALQWTPGRYIESKERYFFFVTKDCMTPHRAPSPYADYMVLEFSKDGIFKEASNIFHVTDDSYIEDLPSALTLRLKSSLDSALIEENYRKP